MHTEPGAFTIECIHVHSTIVAFDMTRIRIAFRSPRLTIVLNALIAECAALNASE
jgi:hypothetical protein